MALTMLPGPELRPTVFPTERLNSRGMAAAPLRIELRRIANVRNAFTVVSVWAQTFGLIVATSASLQELTSILSVAPVKALISRYSEPTRPDTFTVHPRRFLCAKA